MSAILSSPATVSITGLILAGKATFLLTLIFVIRFMVKTTSASARCFITGAGIIVIGCLPMLACVTPEWNLPVPIAIQSSIVSEPAVSSSTQTSPETAQTLSPETTSSSTETQTPEASTGGSALLYIWLVGTAMAVGRVLLGIVGSIRRRHQVEEHHPTRIHELVELASDRIGLRQAISVQVSSRTAVPHISGIITPILHLPQDALHWPDQQLRSVVLHELAHIKRRDHLLWPLANLAVSWLWFNPLVWLALSQMRKDKERACDDYVVACGCNRVNYARHLLETYRSLKASAILAPNSIQFARRNEVQERIMYMLKERTDRRPISRTKQLAVVFLLLVIFIPLTGITGISTTLTSTGEVNAEVRMAVAATLKSFYAALSDGSDFQAISEKFLTSDYFDDTSLTLERQDKAMWLPVFENTTCCITENRPGVVQKVRSRITSLQWDGDELVATLQLDVTGFCLDQRKVRQDADSNVVLVLDRASNKKTAIRECPVVNSLSQQVRFRREDDAWKISRFKDGVTVMRMDAGALYGPIFLVWINDIDKRTTPIGSRAFKVLPRDVVPDVYNAKFILEN